MENRPYISRLLGAPASASLPPRCLRCHCFPLLAISVCKIPTKELLLPPSGAKGSRIHRELLRHSAVSMPPSQLDGLSATRPLFFALPFIKALQRHRLFVPFNLRSSSARFTVHDITLHSRRDFYFSPPTFGRGQSYLRISSRESPSRLCITEPSGVPEGTREEAQGRP